MLIDQATGRNSDNLTTVQSDEGEKLRQQILDEIKTLDVNERVMKSVTLLLNNQLTKFTPELYEELRSSLLFIKESPELQKLLNQVAPFIFMVIANIDAGSRTSLKANNGVSLLTRDAHLNAPYGGI